MLPIVVAKHRPIVVVTSDAQGRLTDACTDAVSSRGAADEPIAARPGEINQLILLAAEENGPAERIKAPLLIIVARDDANADGLRLPHIRAWFDKAPEPKPQGSPKSGQ
jgi:alpha-beta hydrolase superfamily lysophospholipase